MVGLRVLGRQVFLMPLTQQGANAGSGKAMSGNTFLLVLAKTWKGAGGKGDEGKHSILFPPAQGAQDTVKQAAMVQTLTQSCTLFCLFYCSTNRRDTSAHLVTCSLV